jgi:hypothetical protein
MTSTYQPLDTHINGIIKEKMEAWTKFMLSRSHDISLHQRKNAATLFLRKLKVDYVRQSFTESLVQMANEPREEQPAGVQESTQRRTRNLPVTAQLVPIAHQ